MYVVDASVWVGRFVRSDVHHEPSLTWLSDLVERNDFVALPSIALPEISGSVARQTNSTDLGLRAISLIAQIPGARLVPVDQMLADLASENAANLRLRGADAVYVAVARYLSIPLVTWDKELVQRSSAAIEAYTPLEAD